MKRLYLTEISKQRLLGSDKLPYIKNWLTINGVTILHDRNKCYVNEIDFEHAYEAPMKRELKVNFPSNWEEMYNCYTIGDNIGVQTIKNASKEPSFSEKYSRRYKPVSKTALNFKDNKKNAAQLPI